MARFRDERHNPQEMLKKEVSKGVEKVAREITNEGFIINHNVNHKLDTVVSTLHDNFGLEITKEEILLKALEIIAYDNNGVLTENLQIAYADLIGQKIAKQLVSAGGGIEEIHTALKQELVRVQKAGIKLNKQTKQMAALVVKQLLHTSSSEDQLAA